VGFILAITLRLDGKKNNENSTSQHNCSHPIPLKDDKGDDEY
jgi:hypothetical protein